jgi:dTDP-4-amino-4,6-dideoxygalactose transaminase
MNEPYLERLPRFSTIGLAEKINLSKALQAPLSGYLGGIRGAGYWVTKLQDKWMETFHVRYAVACNSATSGLLAACMAAGVEPGSVVWTSAYTMSATAACAKVLGAHIVFIDIETIRFSMNMNMIPSGAMPKCVIVTNLFGHPAYLSAMRSWCDSNKVVMIEDNAQAPFATENGKYAGTIGHLGVFSFNVHKHIQAGEGGVIVTNDSDLGLRLGCAINHGELSESHWTGLNLRMTEPIAAIACAQLAKAPDIIPNRIELAEELTDMVRDIPWIKAQGADIGCKNVYYKWTARIFDGHRNKFISGLRNHGFPMDLGYAKPLHRIFDSGQSLPVAERVEDEEIITFEICGYDPKRRHLNRMRDIIKKVAGEIS